MGETLRPARAAGLCYRAGYLVLWIACAIVFRLWFRLRVENRPRLQGPYVLVANHGSYLDPLLLGAGLTRRIVFLMTEVFFRSPRARWFFAGMRAIPLAARGGNREAIRAARAALQAGEVIGIFPEGGISRDGGLYLGSPGAVALVLAEDVPVVPVAIVGAGRAFGVGHRLPRPRKITLRFGAPIAPEALADGGSSRKERLGRATERIMREIAVLLGQEPREAEVQAAREARISQKA